MDHDEMYRLYARSVYGFLLNLCHDPHIAEELTAETFYQAIRSIERYDGTCQLKTWLFQIAKNMWRKEARRLHISQAKEIYAEEITSPAASIEETVESASQKIVLYKKINALDEPYRTVIYLRLSGDLTFNEIGEILNRTAGWARVTYYRGKERLKEENEK